MVTEKILPFYLHKENQYYSIKGMMELDQKKSLFMMLPNLFFIESIEFLV